jgi:type VI secretion system secreted protein Hcp
METVEKITKGVQFGNSQARKRISSGFKKTQERIMPFTTRLWRVTLGALLLLTLAWLPAAAAVNTYMKIDGVKQGPFKGEVKRSGGTQWISIVAIEHGIESPRDAATGQASGKRQHKPIKITKETDASSPQLARAAAGRETLREVVIEFVRTGPKGGEQVYQTITLTNALLTSVQRAQGRASKEPRPHEELTFTYQKIEVKNSNGKVSAGDDWE